MKINLSKRLRSRLYSITTALSALLLTVCVGSHAHAQGGLLQYLSQAPSSGLKKPTATRAGSPLQISSGGNSYRVMSAASVNVPTAATQSRTSTVTPASGFQGRIGSAIHNAGGTITTAKKPVQQIGFLSGGCDSGGCDSGSGACGGSCGGSGGCYEQSGMGRYVSGGGFACGGYCEPYTFLDVDYLYMERLGDGNFTLSDNYFMDDFGFESGLRFTAGYVPDCRHGFEVSFTGPIDWDMSGSLGAPAGGLTTRLVPGNPIAAADMSAFNDSVFQSQVYEAEYWSLEANKTLIGWDVVKLLLGARYIDYDEDYTFLSQNVAGPSGTLLSSTGNQLFGAQIGLDLLYPVGRFCYADFRTRAGLYLNFADSSTVLGNDGALVLSNRSDDEELAGMFELGSGFRYHLGESLTVRGGTELWYLTGVATVPDQIGQVVRPGTGLNIEMDDDILFYGLVGSIELRL